MIRTVPEMNDQPADSPSASTTRIAALSDGVFAIAMTVLVLDLRAPSHRDGMLLRGLVAQWPAYVGFLASFLYIGVITNHHATFRLIASADRSVTWANLAILCGTVLLPFPTAVLADAFRAGSRADQQTAAILYAALAVLMSMAGSRSSSSSTGGPIPSRVTGASRLGMRRCAGRSSGHSAMRAAPSSASSCSPRSASWPSS